MAKNTPREDESDLISESAAAELIGKHVVVGLAFVDADQKPIRLTQLHGHVVKVNPTDGIVLKQADGSEYALPPTLTGFQKAPRGASCTLRSSGELVEDVDYTVTYTVNQYH